MLSPYLLARTSKLESFAGLVRRASNDVNRSRGVRGVAGIVRDGSERIIPFEEEFAEGVIARSREAAGSWSAGVKVGSYVRFLLGSNRMLVGRVRSLSDGMAEVVVALKLRNVRISTPVGVLENLGSKRVPYYFNGQRFQIPVKE